MARNPILSDEQKTKLAGMKLVYKTNKALAGVANLCSLQAAEALWEILDIFLSAAQNVQTKREVADLLRRYSEVTTDNLRLDSNELAIQKAELVQKITVARSKVRSEVIRLRKALR